MIILLSPAKTLNMEGVLPSAAHTFISGQPQFLMEAKALISLLRPMSIEKLVKLMEISTKLADLNYKRFQAFSTPFTARNAKPALYAFEGDVYDSLDAKTLDIASLLFAEKNLRILSGLYGILRPFDLMQAYRLEMGTKILNPSGKDLYAYWGSRIALAINEAAQSSNAEMVCNLASEEYSKAVKTNALTVPMISPVFKESKGDKHQIVGLFAKRARGMMARYLLEQKATTLEAVYAFNEEGYTYRPDLSEEGSPVFARPSTKA